jgi:carboxyl-terminal processing protease
MRTSLTALARLSVLGLAAAALGCSAGPEPRSSEPGAPPATAYETFDIVWGLVDTKHFDPTHNGVDWEAIGATYRPQIEATRSNADVRRLLQRMLGELGQSHFVIIPSSGGDDRDGPTGGDGTIGMRLGWVDGQATVVGVRENSPAAIAGVQPGWIVESFDDFVATESFAHLVEAMEGSDSPLVAGEATLLLDHSATGSVGSSHTFRFRDTSGTQHEKSITFVEQDGIPVKFSNLPPMQTLLESHWLSSDELSQLGAAETSARIGYITFNVWMFPIMAPFAKAIDEFRDADGLVIDLRRNPGGLGGLAMGIAGHLINEKVSLGTMAMRESNLEFVVNPQRATPDGRLVEPYAGPVALIVDEGTGSTSEVFGAGVQQLGRVHVFGRNSMGAALPAYTERLPNGDVFMFAVANFTGPAGTSIEGTGVVPDHPVMLTHTILETQWDPDLRAAVDWIDSTNTP